MKKFTEVVRGVVKEEIAPVSKQVKSLTGKVTGLTGKMESLGEKVEGINKQVVNLTEKVEGVIIPTLEKHTKYFKSVASSQEKKEDNIVRLDKRLSETEGRLGIQPPPESHIVK